LIPGGSVALVVFCILACGQLSGLTHIFTRSPTHHRLLTIKRLDRASKREYPFHSIELYLKAIILWGAGLVRLQSGEDINTERLFETP